MVERSVITRTAKYLTFGGLCVGLAACGASTAKASPTTTVVRAEHVGKSSPRTSTSTTTTVPNPGQQVLAIINSGNAATVRDENASNWTACAKDFSNAAQQLQALKYPANAQSDAKALISSLNKLAYDAGEIPAAGLSTMEQTVLSDEGSERAASAALRSDLGLPPPAT
jgi:hypothetical protein